MTKLSNIACVACVAAGAALAPVGARANSFHVDYNFTGGADEGVPQGGMVVYKSVIHGMASGISGATPQQFGSLFRYTPSTGSFVTEHTFGHGLDGSLPTGLIYNSGVLYGTTMFGGAYKSGTIFDFVVGTSKENVLASFQPAGHLGASVPTCLLAAGSVYYGVTSLGGGSGNPGTVFSFTPAAKTITTLHIGGVSGGRLGPLVYDGNALYGASATGGDGDLGLLYEIDMSTGAAAPLYSFQPTDLGVQPQAGLTDVGGVLYGATLGNGSNLGMVFSYTLATGALAVVTNFTNADDGRGPNGNLLYEGGFLYGTIAAKAGAAVNQYGSVFKISLATGLETVLHVFGGGDGADPRSPLTYYNGAIYGVTSGGGTQGAGTLFQVAP